MGRGKRWVLWEMKSEGDEEWGSWIVRKVESEGAGELGRQRVGWVGNVGVPLWEMSGGEVESGGDEERGN